jgi:OOP family OmpA-OmpF porin
MAVKTHASRSLAAESPAPHERCSAVPARPLSRAPVGRGRTARSLGPRAVGVLALAGALSLTGSAEAKDPRIPDTNGSGMDLHLFRPPLDSKGLASVNGADVLGAWDWAIGLFVDYGNGFMELNEGHGTDQLVEHAFNGTLQFNLGFLDLFSIGISGPVTLMAGGAVTDIGPTGATYDNASYNQESLGFLALHTKFRILHPRSVIGLAIAGQVGFATGQAGPRSLASEPGVWFWPQVILEKQWLDPQNELRLAVNAGFRGHTGDNPQFGLGQDGLPQLSAGEFEYGQLVTSGLGLSYRVIWPLDLFAETYMSALVTGKSDAAQRISAEAIGGLKIHVEDRSFLFLAGGAGYTPGFQSSTARAVIGFVFEPSQVDTDGDGIPDKEDACPNRRGVKTEDPETNGCPPPPPADRDGDGIPDERDKCPDVPGLVEFFGCQEPKDRDRDGIPDNEDACPDTPGAPNKDPQKHGCPIKTGDRDGDGIMDNVDECPDQAEDFDNFKDNDGCPDPDNDEDGIPDNKDACPDEPGPPNADPKKNGCPDAKIVFTGKSIWTLEKIQFATGSARILPQSMPIVAAVADIMRKNSNLTVLGVAGHADERGNEQMNLTLTKARAQSVVQALAGRGIAASRLRSQGYGVYCPIDDRHQAEAWEKNRRVEFKVMATTEGSAGTELGCKAAREKGVEDPKP